MYFSGKHRECPESPAYDLSFRDVPIILGEVKKKLIEGHKPTSNLFFRECKVMIAETETPPSVHPIWIRDTPIRKHEARACGRPVTVEAIIVHRYD